MQRVFEEDVYADVAFRAESRRAHLDARGRAFAQRLAYGTIQRRATLDHVLGVVSDRALEAIDPPLRDALRMGVLQLLELGGVPDRAAVDQTVELAKLGHAGAAGFTNAVMRRAAREARAIVGRLEGVESPAEAAVLYSYPEWLAALWWGVFGRDEALALLRAGNVAPESAVRANGLLVTREEARAALAAEGVASLPAPGLPEGLLLETPFDVHGSQAFASGVVMPQSRASMLVARLLAPKAGERVLDLCSAPGAKATHVAALMSDRGSVVAVEAHPGRAEALRSNVRRLQSSSVEVRVADATRLPGEELFDRVLLDPPCSGLGTLAARPDARWRKSPGQVERLCGLQAELLAAGARRVRPGGTLVYSTCTISPRENEERVEDLLARRRDFTADDLAAEHPALSHPAAPRFLQLLPHRDGTDGFFIARLRRSDR